MINEKDLHNDLYDEQDLNESSFDSNCDEEEDDYFSNLIDEIDFSEIRGKNFKQSLSKVNRVIGKKKAIKKPLKRSVGVKRTATIHGNTGKTNNILVPRDRAVIVNGLNEFILSNNKAVSDSKDVGLHNGRRLKELVITIFNDTTNDFDVDLFNPSASLEYLFSSGQNLNDRIQIAGGNVKYSDVLFNILANPIHIIKSKLTVAGALVGQQFNQTIRFSNKSATGKQIIAPYQVQLQIDTMQVAGDIVFFDFSELETPFIADGMNTAQYKVLAGNTITFAFFYDQMRLAKHNFKNVKNINKLL